MSADMHIHILAGATEDDLAYFNSNTLGSKYFNPAGHKSFDSDESQRILNTPNVFVGEVSWLKYALFGDDEYVPDTLSSIADLFEDELVTIDDAFIASVKTAFDLPNNTQYGIAIATEVIEFLSRYKGYQAFTISW